MKNSFQARCILDYHAGITKGRTYTIVDVKNFQPKFIELFGLKSTMMENYVLLNDFAKFVSVPANCFEKT